MPTTIESRAKQLPLVTWLDRRTPRQRRAAVAVVAVYLLYRALRLVGNIVLDRWWYDTVTDAPVWSTRFWAQTQLLVLALVLLVPTIGLAVWRPLSTPKVDAVATSPIVRWYHAKVGPAHRWGLMAIGLWIAWSSLREAPSVWQQWLLFRKGPGVGAAAPELGLDIGYYLFRLPFLSWFSGWLRQLLVIALVISTYGYVASGAIRIPGGSRHSNLQAKRHLGFLGASLLIVQALHYLLVQRAALAVNRTGNFDGPGFTQLKFVVPGLWIVAIAAVVVAIVVAASPGRRTWRTQLTAIAVLLGLHGALLIALPALSERFLVAPAEADRQLSYIAHNLEATRRVYGLDAIGTDTITIDDGTSSSPSVDQLRALDRVPVYTEGQLTAALQVLQGTTATRIGDVDLDRYEIDGVERPVMIAARNPSLADLPERGWVQQHLVYTNGDGVVMVPADHPAPDGRPDSDALLALAPERTEMYYSELVGDWYAIVGTRRRQQHGAEYLADNGIPLDSFFRRLVTASAFGEIDPLFTSELTDDSQLLIRRSIKQRIGAIAPFLALDADPYPVVVDERVVWIVDAYTTSATYPYAQFASTADVRSGGSLRGRTFNYLAASVRVTVDSVDGSTRFYRLANADDDVILDAWQSVFPAMFEPEATMPAGLRPHVRYPHDALQVQANLLGRYHVREAEQLFSGSDRWNVSPKPADAVAGETGGPSAAVDLFITGIDGLEGHWGRVLPFGPGATSNANATRDELAALLIASNDDPGLLRLLRLQPATGRQISSPQVAQSAIDADPELARDFTLLNANGSRVQFGAMTPLLLDDGLVWVRSVVVSGTASTTAPRVHGVVAVSSGLVGSGPNTASAVETAAAAGATEGGTS